MDFPSSAAMVPRLIVLDRAGSTNDEAAALAGDPDAPDLTVVVTADQTGGRGRMGRQWVAPRGSALAISALVRSRPDDDPVAKGWLPILAGVAMVDAVAPVIRGVAGFKWPNDVLVGGRKLCGILAEALPGGDVVIGAGLNTAMTKVELPVPTATSLAIEGAATDAATLDRVLAAYLSGLARRIGALRVTGADGSGLHRAARERCTTLGRDVRIELPGGRELHGVAEDLAPDGALLVRTPGGVTAVSAGDVHHVR